MRIVHVSDFYLPRLGGIETQVADLTARQAAAGHDVGVATATRPTRGSTLDPARLDRGVRVERAGRLGRFGVVPPAGRELLRTADVVHVHLGGVAPLGWAVLSSRAEAGLPTVVTVHSVLDRMHLLHRAVGALGGWSQAPTVWCGVSRRVADQLRALLGPSATVRVLPNAVDQDRWAPGAPLPATNPPGAIRPRPSRRDGEVLVVAALRHTRRKRVEALPGILARAEALTRTAAVRRGTVPPRLVAVIAGAGSRTPALRRGLASAGIEGWVALPGRLDQASLRDLYHRADLFVAPTVLESFGLAALEARAAGLPVVARADSGSGEVLESGSEALLVGSDEAMAEAVARLAVDEPLRRRMAAHNRTMRPAFDWAATLTLVDQAYLAACRLSGPGSGHLAAQELSPAEPRHRAEPVATP